jgi:capsular polysaccharide biosynthesis protein
VNEPDHHQTVTWPGGIGDELPDGLLAYDDFTPADDRPSVDVPTGLVSLAFIRAALRRSAWVWCLTAVAGLLIGSALYLKFPPAYHASTEVLVIDGPNADPAVTIQTDASLAQSSTVAERVVKQLGLKQSVSSFLAAYTVTVINEQVLQINVGAPSSRDAQARAAAVATAFLKFHAQTARAQQQQVAADLDQQVKQAQQRVSAINKQITQVSAEPTSHRQQAELTALQSQRQDAINALAQVRQYATSTLASARSATSAIVNNSQVLDQATPIPRSKVKGAALYLAGGLFGGLAVGAAIVIVLALMSDRLRRRDDVADAIGAPVRLSVGSLRKSRLPARPGGARARDVNLRRVVAHLRNCVPGSSRGPAGLAIVAVDDVQIVARAVESLAVSCANQGRQVVVADLSSGAHLARLLGSSEPGISRVSRDGAHLTVAVPRDDDVAPIGPLQGGSSPAVPDQADPAVVAACASADLVLTMVTLDPSFGADHLATWATDVVAVVTAGRSSAERIHGVGEMIRLAGARLDSVVLIGADKTDESLGVTRSQDQSDLVKPGSA